MEARRTQKYTLGSSRFASGRVSEETLSCGRVEERVVSGYMMMRCETKKEKSAGIYKSSVRGVFGVLVS